MEKGKKPVDVRPVVEPITLSIELIIKKMPPCRIGNFTKVITEESDK